MLLRNIKFVVSILLIGLLSLTLGIYFPWWIISLVAFGVSILLPMHPAKAFWSGFTSIFLCWGLMALFIDSSNDHILSSKIAHILPLGGSSLAMVLVSSIIGALVGGLSSLTGTYLRKLFNT